MNALRFSTDSSIKWMLQHGLDPYTTRNSMHVKTCDCNSKLKDNFHDNEQHDANACCYVCIPKGSRHTVILSVMYDLHVKTWATDHIN